MDGWSPYFYTPSMILHKAETLEQTVSLSQTADCYTEHVSFPAAVLLYPTYEHEHVTCPVHQLAQQLTRRVLVWLNAGVVLFTDVSSCQCVHRRV